MTNESDLTRKVDNAVIEVSFGQNRPVTVRVIELQKGSRVDARIRDKVVIDGIVELVIGQTPGRLSIIRYEENGEIVEAIRVLNNNTIQSFHHYTSFTRYRHGTKDYKHLQKALELAGIRG